MAFVLGLAGCGGGTAVNDAVYIPDFEQPKRADTYYIEGWKNLKDRNPRQALKNFQRSEMENVMIYIGFGYAYLAQNKLNMAKENFEKALSLEPENMYAHVGLAGLYESLKENDKAFDVYSRLRASHPENVWVKSRYESIKASETQNYLKQATQLKNQNKLEAYFAALESASRYSPEMIEIKLEIADFFMGQAQYEKACRQYEQVLEKKPDDENILVKMAGVYEKMNKYDSAILIYKKLLELKPGNSSFSVKIDELKSKFLQSNLPGKFKNIFFKETVNREELAALIGYYFDKYLETKPPVIITDIGSSFAKEYIIKICTLDIMQLRADHSFDRFTRVNRASFAVTMDALLKYLERMGAGSYTIQFTPVEVIMEPADISPLHKDYETIKFLVNSGIIKLEGGKNFNPTLEITPTESLEAIKKILNSIRMK